MMSAEAETGREGEAQSPVTTRTPISVAGVIERIRTTAARELDRISVIENRSGGPPTVDGDVRLLKNGYLDILEALDDYVKTIPIQTQVSRARSRQMALGHPFDGPGDNR